jgi:hypothetical protein
LKREVTLKLGREADHAASCSSISGCVVNFPSPGSGMLHTTLHRGGEREIKGCGIQRNAGEQTLSSKTLNHEIKLHDIGTLPGTAGRGEDNLRLTVCGLLMGGHKDRPYTVCQSFAFWLRAFCDLFSTGITWIALPSFLRQHAHTAPREHLRPWRAEQPLPCLSPVNL